MKMKIGFITVVCLLSFLLLFAPLVPLWGQTASTGALTVTAKDPSGAAIPGATVAIENASGVTREDKTTADGPFTFTFLPPGMYRVTTSAPGFKTVEAPSVTVNVTETHVLSQTLEIGAQQQEVTVSASAEEIQTEPSSLGGVVSSRAISELPMPTRNFTALMSLSAGVTANVTNAAAWGNGSVSIFTNGEDDTSNTYIVDGSNVSNFAGGVT